MSSHHLRWRKMSAAAPADSAMKEVKAADQAVKQDLAHASNEAAHGEHAEGEEDHAELKHSPSVKAIAKATGLSVGVAYWLLVVLNFAIIGVLFGWALKKNLPGIFRRGPRPSARAWTRLAGRAKRRTAGSATLKADCRGWIRTSPSLKRNPKPTLRQKKNAFD